MNTPAADAVPAAPVDRTNLRMSGGFVLIGTGIDVRVPLPIQISEELRLERPNDAQRAILDPLLNWVDQHGMARRSFEAVARIEDRGGGNKTIHYENLQPNDHRYLLLSFSGTNFAAHEFLSAAQLVKPTLWALLTAYTSEPYGRGVSMGYGGDTLAYQRQQERWMSGESHPILDEPAVGRIRSAFHALRNFDKAAHPAVARAVDLFALFSRMPLMRVFDVLAMFMLIEMLLTHNPNDKEIGDSLSHQIEQKVPFVFERMNDQLDYSVFGEGPAATIWKKLYKYRSSMAHGDTPDFGSSLQILRSAEIADTFLLETVRRLIRHSLDDPKLLQGLKPM